MIPLRPLILPHAAYPAVELTSHTNELHASKSSVQIGFPSDARSYDGPCNSSSHLVFFSISAIAICAASYGGYVMPVTSLAFINADIGEL